MRLAVTSLAHLAIAVFLTLLTQLGGIAWLAALWFRRRFAAFVLLYAVLSVAALWLAPVFGRSPVSCISDSPLQVQSPLYCILNRTYVTDDLLNVLTDAAAEMDQNFPGTVTLLLDAGFPFLDGFPLLPHLSHDDGRKADLAFYYRSGSEYVPGQTRSPLGYFAFEEGPTDCPEDWPTLRWNLSALQTLWPDLALDEERMRHLLRHLNRDRRVARIFVEPHLTARLGVSGAKFGFQGCRAARHDDHVHLQL